MTRPSDNEAAIAKVLRENGIVEHPTTPEQAEEGIHSWRCGYPDTYGNGPCTCFAGLVEDLAALAGAGAQVTEATRLKQIVELQDQNTELRKAQARHAAQMQAKDEQLAGLRAERDVLAQTMWDGWATLGFDTDGDNNPGAWIAGARSYQVFAEQWLRDVREHRKDDDDGADEWTEDINRLDAAVAECDDLRARISALADEYQKDADQSDNYGGELWSTTATALRNLLDRPAAAEGNET